MIEQCIMPVIRRVAGTAVVAESTAMYVMLAMACDTCSRRFAVRFACGMAGIASNRAMAAKERKVCQRMIKRRFVEIDNYGVAAFVLEVTVCALASFIRREATVKPFA